MSISFSRKEVDMMNIRKILMAGFILLFFLGAADTPFGASGNDPMVYIKNQTLSEQTAENFGEEKNLTVPEKPLDFVTTVNWKISVDKKLAFSTAVKPFAKIYTIDVRGGSKQEVVINSGETKNGSIRLQPGQLCRIQLNSGQYKGLFGKKYGGVVKATCEYQYIKVTATELDSLGKLSLTAEGPKNCKWVWSLPGNQKLSGTTIQSIFQPGTAAIRLDDEEQYHNFELQLAVPEALEINPQLSSTSGYEEFTVKGSAALKSHYQSYSQCWWNFGDGTPELNGSDFEHTFRKKGTYNVTLTARNSLGQNIEKNWQIVVMPFNIINNDVSVYPAQGSTPLRVYYSARPKVFGQPSQLEYLWDFGDGATSQSISGEHVYSKKGDYKISLRLKDDYHPNLYIAPWTGTVTVLPPVITVNVQGAPATGVIPLQVRFLSEIKVEGGPTDIEYQWDFGDYTNSNLPNPTHTFGKPGQYKVILTVRDWRNDTSFTSSILVNALPPQITSQSSLEPLSGPAPLQVRGMGNADVEGYPVDLSYAWYINDQLVANTRSWQYNFRTPGYYKVTLLIKDNLPGHTARVTHSWQVTVSDSGRLESRPLPTPVPTPTPYRHQDDRNDRHDRSWQTPVPTLAPTPIKALLKIPALDGGNDNHDRPLRTEVLTPTPAATSKPTPAPTKTPAEHRNDSDGGRKQTPAITPGITPAPTEVPGESRKEKQKEKPKEKR
jgi:PKD repeat protein